MLPPTLMEEDKENVGTDAELVQPAVPGKRMGHPGLEEFDDPIPVENGHSSGSKSLVPDVLNTGTDFLGQQPRSSHALDPSIQSSRPSGGSRSASCHVKWISHGEQPQDCACRSLGQSFPKREACSGL